MLLAGQKVVVVGGSSGIGLSTAELAKSEGADVTIASRNAERLKATAEKLGVKSMPADVTSDESVAQLFQQCGVINHVVVTAAQLRTGPFKTVPMIQASQMSPGGDWSNPVPLSDTGRSASDPRIVVDQSGNLTAM